MTRTLIITAVALAITPVAVAGTSVTLFEPGTTITGSLEAKTITLEGIMVDSTCAGDPLKDSPIDPAIMPCDEGSVFALILNKDGTPDFGLHGTIVSSNEKSITVANDEDTPLFVVGNASSVEEVDLYGIWGTNGTSYPDVHAVKGSDGVLWATSDSFAFGDLKSTAEYEAIWGTNGTSIWGTNGTSIWGTNGTSYPDLHAIWGTNGTSIWGTNGTSVVDGEVPELFASAATGGVLAELEAGVKAFASLPYYDLDVLVEKEQAAVLEPVNHAVLETALINPEEACKSFGCN